MKNLLKFIIIVFFILVISFGIPFTLYQNINEANYYTYGDNASTDGPMGYYGLIVSDQNSTNEIKINALNLWIELQNILNGCINQYSNIIFLMGIIIGILIISIGIILLKAIKNKYSAYAFIISGTLTIIAYIFIYIIFFIS